VPAAYQAVSGHLAGLLSHGLDFACRGVKEVRIS